MIITTGYLVSCCGCTDCFPNAIFFDPASANDFAKNNCRNPEGFLIKPIDISQLNLKDD